MAPTSDRLRKLLNGQWAAMDHDTRIALTVLAEEIDQRDRDAEKIRDEMRSLRHLLYTLLGTVVTAGIADGLITVFS